MVANINDPMIDVPSYDWKTKKTKISIDSRNKSKKIRKKPFSIQVIVAAKTVADESPTPTPLNNACVAKLFIILEQNACILSQH